MADLYTNENFPFPAAQELRRLGHDVMTVQESGLGGQSVADDEVLNFATGRLRILVTLNRRHFVRLHEQSGDHAGIIVCTADNDFLALAGRIHEALLSQRSLAGLLLRIHRSG